jgi:hypothetical protein
VAKLWCLRDASVRADGVHSAENPAKSASRQPAGGEALRLHWPWRSLREVMAMLFFGRRGAALAAACLCWLAGCDPSKAPADVAPSTGGGAPDTADGGVGAQPGSSGGRVGATTAGSSGDGGSRSSPGASGKAGAEWAGSDAGEGGESQLGEGGAGTTAAAGSGGTVSHGHGGADAGTNGGTPAEGEAGDGGHATGEGGFASGGEPAAGGVSATSGSGASGGTGGSGANSGAGGTGASDGTGGGGASSGAGGSGSGANSGAGGGGSGGTSCTFTVNVTTSAQIPTVGIVEWSTTLGELASAQVVYALDGAETGVLNRGGIAPADAGEAHHRTLLLGLKPERAYTLHVEAESRSGTTCRSDDYTLATGALANAPAISREAVDAAAQAPGFIIAPGGVGSRAPVAIIDADGTVVWSFRGPDSCSRARLDHAGRNLWMLAINPSNRGGDMRAISLDGALEQKNVPGLERAHHDFTLLDNGNLAVFVWASAGLDPESDLVEVRTDGSVSPLFRIGTRQYPGGESAFGGSPNSYHCNSIDYHASDDSFTIGDRNPNLYVKVSRSGDPLWQFGGSCQASRVARCVPGSWRVNHGHDLLEDGTFVLFSNADFGDTGTPSNIQQYQLDMSEVPSATPQRQWSGGGAEHSDTLGDVQLLPNGNTLVTFSNNGAIYELDPEWNVVQTLRASSFGYSEWRPTLYGQLR